MRTTVSLAGTPGHAAARELDGRTLEAFQDGREVLIGVSSQPASWRCVEVSWSDHDQSDAVGGDELIATGVVQRALNSAVDTADGQPIGLVEMRDRLVVLELAVLDNDIACWPIAIDG